MKKRLKAYEREIEFCSYCPKLCRFACPVAEITASEASTPTGKMTIIKLVKDGALEFNSEVALLIYQCSGCLLSRTYCEHRIEVIGAFEAIRAIAVEKGLAPKRVLEFGNAWAKFRNPYGEDLSSRLKSLAQARESKKSPVLVFPGCTMSHYFPDTIKDLLLVLDQLELNYQVFNQEYICCGYPLYAIGHWKILEEHKKWLAEKLSGYELILSPCPTCVYFLKSQYLNPGIAEVKKIQHISEFISENLAGLNFQTRISGKIVYHDPCHLGRYLNVYQPPREILKAITQDSFLEFYESQEQAECCGGGGGLPLAHPQIARAISKNKLEEFKALGGEVLASACPMCERMFARTGREQGIVVKDLISLLAQSLGKK